MSQHAATPQRHRRRTIMATSVAATVLGLAGIGYAAEAGGTLAAGQATTSTTQQQTLERLPSQQQELPAQEPGTPDPGDRGGWGTQGGAGGQDLTGDTTSGTTATDATAAQEVGLVDINTTLDYGSGEAAGTGMILTSDGEILTNHHVVEGATAISVEVVSTGQTYDAEVVGYDATHDVAVLQLDDASGLTPVTTDTTSVVQVGDAVTGVGNANGDGGAASASAGTVSALDRSITVSNESDGSSSRLSGLIQVDADIISGDSGGALYDADGEVIGMDTAASSGSADVTGYAVPIAEALGIADQIVSGAESSTVQVGSSAFLGVELSSQDTGAVVQGTVDGSAAAEAGIEAGSTVTGIDGTSVTTAEQLSAAVAGLTVGDRVTVTWTDTSGGSQSATVVLGAGPVG